MPTINDVLRVFDALGGKYVQPGALIAHIEKEGFDPSATAQAVDAAIGAGKLAWSENRSLYRP